jgi:hypothetical protein
LLELAQALVERAETDSDAPIPVILELSEWRTVTKRKSPKFWEQEKYDPSIKEWILSQLRSKGVSQEIGEQWIREKELVLLLDGLDELPSERQAKCVRAINQFLDSEFSPLHLVVCSRKEEYENYAEVLHLNGAICLEDLTVEQMRHYFASVNLGEFWESIKDSEKIVNFISQPLFLAIASIAYQQIDVEEWRNCNTEERAIDYLLGIFRVKMLTKISRNKSFDESFLSVNAGNVLVPIAQFLNKSTTAEVGICIGDLQPYFLQDIGWKFINGLATLFVILLLIFSVTFFSLKFDNENEYIVTALGKSFLFFDIAFATILLTPLGLFFDLDTKKLEGENTLCKIYINKTSLIYVNFVVCFFIVQIIIWSYKIICVFIKDYAILGKLCIFTIDTYWLFDNTFLICVIFSSFIFNLYILLISDFRLLFGGEYLTTENIQFVEFNSYDIIARKGQVALCIIITFVLIGSLAVGNIAGFKFSFFCLIAVSLFCEIMIGIFRHNEKSLERTKNKVNSLRSFHESIINSIFLFFFGFLSIFSGYLLGFFTLNAVIVNGTTVGMIFSLFAVIPCIQYIVLRLILQLSSQMPWNITRFLDQCTERLILQRVGNRYRFIHRLVQEHFANLEIQKE